MIGQVLKLNRVVVVSHAVQLNALVIVDVQVLALSCGKHGLVLEELHISHFVLSLKFTN